MAILFPSSFEFKILRYIFVSLNCTNPPIKSGARLSNDKRPSTQAAWKATAYPIIMMTIPLTVIPSDCPIAYIYYITQSRSV